MSIIGTPFDPRRGEPRELLDAIREEVFSDISGDSEVDVYVAFEVTDTVIGVDGKEWPLLRAIDYIVARINQEYLVDADPHVGSNEHLMAVDDWARSVEGVDSYMLIHRHPDGLVEATSKDHRMMATLVSIDFARGDHRRRLLTGGAILDSFTSIPLVVTDYWPPLYIGNAEIDIPIAEGLLEIAQNDPNAPAFAVKAAQWTVDHIHELVELKESDPHGETPRSQELFAEMEALMGEGAQAIREEGRPLLRGGAMLGLDAAGNLVESDLGDLPPKIREIFERLLGDLDAADAPGSLTLEGPSLAEPFEPPAPNKPSIFDLPELGKEDDGPKINWN